MKYSNKRRSHIHIIKQYIKETGEYTGTRIVIYIKGLKGKKIYDKDNFKIHRYKNSKSKKNNKSLWTIVHCPIDNVIKKQMTNTSEDNIYVMHHTIYESDKLKDKQCVDRLINKIKI
ncbi:hypothetical protein CLOACE_16280 [Clostridium acetireducens DSM 10703]|uniref:Uncharacterized protein n=1 Tax=Clostridium acetireducens DSM 10703 TaxID=1121290 RepID=A0A1E8EXN8_9CLOT|nr:hypothetical protein [Clostridium acetireducens]OFI05545.1 hypothetical protein CLOACE_16280 [Clostridium acetireducens DSM 10703]